MKPFSHGPSLDDQHPQESCLAKLMGSPAMHDAVFCGSAP
jgi:hypothetical protein